MADLPALRALGIGPPGNFIFQGVSGPIGCCQPYRRCVLPVFGFSFSLSIFVYSHKRDPYYVAADFTTAYLFASVLT